MGQICEDGGGVGGGVVGSLETSLGVAVGNGCFIYALPGLL